MPTFNFTSPEGKSYQINGPEGATKEQAFQILQTQLGQSTVPRSAADQIPGVKSPSRPVPPAAHQQEPGLLDKLEGAGETALSLGTGAIAGPIGAAGGILKGVSTGKFAKDREAEKYGSDLMGKLTYEPKTQKGKEYSGALGDFFKTAGIEGLGGLSGETAALGEAANVAKPAIAARAGQAASAIKNVPSAIGTGAKNVGSAAAKAAYSPEKLALAQKAQQYGLQLSPDMLSDNKVIKSIGEALRKVPASGAKTEANQTAFNQALIKQIGGDPKATKLTSEVYANAMKKSGEEIGRIGEQNGVKIDKAAKDAIFDFGKDVKKYETSDVKSVVSSYIKEIQDKSKGGTLDGTAFKKLNSKIGRQIRSTSNGDLKNSLGDLQEIMHDALEKSISKEDLASLKQSRANYAKGKTLEPLVAKTQTGDISGPSLMSRVTADKAGKSRMAMGQGGELGDLARIGQLMKDPASSGTAERGLAYGLLGGGAYANPGIAAGVYGGANLYNRLGQYLIPPPPK